MWDVTKKSALLIFKHRTDYFYLTNGVHSLSDRRQRRAPATGASDGRQRRAPAMGTSDGRQRRAPATGVSDGRQRRAPATVADDRPWRPFVTHWTTITWDADAALRLPWIFMYSCHVAHFMVIMSSTRKRWLWLPRLCNYQWAKENEKKSSIWVKEWLLCRSHLDANHTTSPELRTDFP